MNAVREGFGAKLRLLMDTRRDENGQPYPVSSVARAVGISEQALWDLLNSSDETPRIDTVRRLAEFYGISLDYFHCHTLHECQLMLQSTRFDEGKPDR